MKKEFSTLAMGELLMKRQTIHRELQNKHCEFDGMHSLRTELMSKEYRKAKPVMAWTERTMSRPGWGDTGTTLALPSRCGRDVLDRRPGRCAEGRLRCGCRWTSRAAAGQGLRQRGAAPARVKRHSGGGSSWPCTKKARGDGKEKTKKKTIQLRYVIWLNYPHEMDDWMSFIPYTTKQWYCAL